MKNSISLDLNDYSNETSTVIHEAHIDLNDVDASHTTNEGSIVSDSDLHPSNPPVICPINEKLCNSDATTKSKIGEMGFIDFNEYHSERKESQSFVESAKSTASDVKHDQIDLNEIVKIDSKSLDSFAIKQFEEEVCRQMNVDGLVISPRNLRWDGKFNRCGTIGKENKKDGSYIIDPKLFYAYWKNWRSGKEGWYSHYSVNEMSTEEFYSFQKKLDEARKKQEEQEREKHKAAQKKAQKIWDSLPDAPENHPYLLKHGIKPFGIKWDSKRDRLVIPVYGPNGEIQSLQFIYAHLLSIGSNKVFMPYGRTKDGYFLIQASKDHENDTILIGEGYATCASLHMATGYPVCCAFSASNLESIALFMKLMFPNRKIVICADYDKPNSQISGEGGTGVYYARNAARVSGCPIAIAPPLENGKGDFNDLHLAKGLEAVCEIIALAQIEDSVAISEDVLPDGFFFKGDRLYHQREAQKKGGKLPKPEFLCKGLRILGTARDSENKSWALYLEWHDPDGKKHTWILLKDSLVGSSRDVAIGYLQSHGLEMSGNKHAWGLLCQFLLEYKTQNRFRTAKKTGWMKGHPCFVLPNENFGAQNFGEQVVLDRPVDNELFQTAGTFEEWKRVGEYCAGNSRMAFAICCAFTAPLLYIAKMESGGFLLVGPSSSGKTTMLFLSASVWGGGAHVLTWRATDNALEGKAALFSDCLMVIDELGQGDSQAIGKAIYMLSQGVGKERMNSQAQLCSTSKWRILILSSGEIGLGDKFSEVGASPKAGQFVRFCEIGVEKSDIVNLHAHVDVTQFVNHIKTITSENFGHAGREFLRKLTEPAHFSHIYETINETLTEIVNLICPPSVDGQVKRVALRFALVAYAGQLAVDFGILPKELNPLIAVRTCFKAWLEERGGTGPAEDMQILSQMRLFLERHGLDNFRNEDAEEPDKRDIVRNMVGFRTWNQDNTYSFYILPESFKKIMEGHNAKRALKVLAEEGWLIKQDRKRFKSRHTFEGYGQTEVYHICIPNLDNVNMQNK